ncbi:hypothetical protein WA845_08405 [Agrobacterium sp. CMT1]|uniref:hypothetical protein n=1 Tax=Agrobacterium sp. CMT1 TaxID=3128901 RepID=UPI003077B181
MSVEEIKKALAAAEQFIVNGVELAYIRMPDPQTPDSANDTLPMIRNAQTALEILQRENEELRQRLDIGPCGEDAIDVAESAADHLLHRAEAAEAEVKRLRAVVERAQLIVSTSTYPNWHEAARTALASTGGEHNAE